MDSIPIQTSLVFNEKIWGNCHHRIHQRTNQHRICVLRLYLARLTKIGMAPHQRSNIQPAKLQGIKRPSKLSSQPNELFVFSDLKAQWCERHRNFSDVLNYVKVIRNLKLIRNKSKKLRQRNSLFKKRQTSDVTSPIHHNFIYKFSKIDFIHQGYF
jgi:hypothetical protein